MLDNGLATTTQIPTTRKRRFLDRICAGLLAGWTRTIRAGHIAQGRESDALRQAGWVPVARSREVGRKVLVRRLVQGDRTCTVLFWRTRANRPVAMDAMCPHRTFLMEDAHLRGDALECPLHRRLFGPTGACVNRPDTTPARTMTIYEAAGQIWLQPMSAIYRRNGEAALQSGRDTARPIVRRDRAHGADRLLRTADAGPNSTGWRGRTRGNAQPWRKSC